MSEIDRLQDELNIQTAIAENRFQRIQELENAIRQSKVAALPEGDSLESYWEALRPKTPSVPEMTPQELSTGPGDLVIGTSRHRVLVVIRANGTLVFGPEYTPDEAAVIFWENLGRRRLGAEDRILVLQHIEATIVRLGELDLECERRRMAVQADPENRQLLVYANLATSRLEAAAHQTIELGRALALLDVAVEQPSQIPQSVANTDSGYTGIQLED